MSATNLPTDLWVGRYFTEFPNKDVTTALFGGEQRKERWKEGETGAVWCAHIVFYSLLFASLQSPVNTAMSSCLCLEPDLVKKQYLPFAGENSLCIPAEHTSRTWCRDAVGGRIDINSRVSRQQLQQGTNGYLIHNQETSARFSAARSSCLPLRPRDHLGSSLLLFT